jgi:hypothetical protein
MSNVKLMAPMRRQNGILEKECRDNVPANSLRYAATFRADGNS